MDLSKILSPAGDDDVEPRPSPPSPSPSSPSLRADDGLPVSSRWSVDEMRSAVAILSDFPLAPPASSSSSSQLLGDTGGRSRLDLLFQADAMIQQRQENLSSPTAPAPAPSTPPATYVRSGVWTRAEEEYAAALIFYFLRGALPLAEGTTLRKYLAEQLCCNRRRVSMKLATEAIADKKIPRKVGASVFVALRPPPTQEETDEMMETLSRLRNECFQDVNAAASDGDHTVRDQMDMNNRRTRDAQDDGGLDGDYATLSSPDYKTKNLKKKKRTLSTSSFSSTASSSLKRSPPQIKRRRPLIIRTGFDSQEEEQYVTTLVEYFTDGLLDLADGTRLVTYLCEQLQCSAKTLSMKLAPRKSAERKFPSAIGSLTYTRKPEDDASVSEQIFEAEAHAFELRQAWLVTRDDQDDAVRNTKRKPNRRVESSPVVNDPITVSPSRHYSRSGPWSRQEEEYAAALIDCFFRGVLELPEGTTLRSFLTSRLRCNPMRISKKLASENIADIKIPKKLGSATYVRRDNVSEEERQQAEALLMQHEEAPHDVSFKTISFLFARAMLMAV
ncbi:hypothetical protein P43SY_008644 [Pythium insidiosum]|uniref:Uncharacterized protein n=1 Tax=Pythium insidiosum TaxID=114742 RepID=A0AAD5LCM0_PYTIN|nr:hypothetical protein P43SY_008644 [Pythium insidiosum]